MMFNMSNVGRNVPRPRQSGIGGVKGHNMNEKYIAGKPRRACPVLTGWAGSFINRIRLQRGGTA
jgi:hypothetical protein